MLTDSFKAVKENTTYIFEGLKDDIKKVKEGNIKDVIIDNSALIKGTENIKESIGETIQDTFIPGIEDLGRNISNVAISIMLYVMVGLIILFALVMMAKPNPKTISKIYKNIKGGN